MRKQCQVAKDYKTSGSYNTVLYQKQTKRQLHTGYADPLGTDVALKRS